MRVHFCAILITASCVTFCGGQAQLAPEDKQLVTDLRGELSHIEEAVKEAEARDAELAGGLIKALIQARIEILKTNHALIEQRIHAIESNAPVQLKVSAVKPDPATADELLQEISLQQQKVKEAKAKSDLYAGGLVKALAESALATNQNTLAMLEQRYYSAKYGLFVPAANQTTSSNEMVTTPAPKPATNPADECLDFENLDSSVVDTNDVFWEVAWKVDIRNKCERQFSVTIEYTISDGDEFELDSDSESVFVPANGVGKARGKLLLDASKGPRMGRHGVSMSSVR